MESASESDRLSDVLILDLDRLRRELRLRAKSFAKLARMDFPFELTVVRPPSLRDEEAVELPEDAPFGMEPGEGDLEGRDKDGDVDCEDDFVVPANPTLDLSPPVIVLVLSLSIASALLMAAADSVLI